MPSFVILGNVPKIIKGKRLQKTVGHYTELAKDGQGLFFAGGLIDQNPETLDVMPTGQHFNQGIGIGK